MNGSITDKLKKEELEEKKLKTDKFTLSEKEKDNLRNIILKCRGFYAANNEKSDLSEKYTAKNKSIKIKYKEWPFGERLKIYERKEGLFGILYDDKVFEAEKGIDINILHGSIIEMEGIEFKITKYKKGSWMDYVKNLRR